MEEVAFLIYRGWYHLLKNFASGFNPVRKKYICMNSDQMRGKEYWNKTRLQQNWVMMGTSVPSDVRNFIYVQLKNSWKAGALSWPLVGIEQLNPSIIRIFLPHNYQVRVPAPWHLLHWGSALLEELHKRRLHNYLLILRRRWKRQCRPYISE